MKPRGQNGREGIAFQLAFSFGAVSVVALVMCASLLAEVREVSSLVDWMRRDEEAVRQSLELAAAVREQYIHMAHTMIEGDRSHLDHYEGWHDTVVARVRDLEPLTPVHQRWRVAIVAAASDAAHQRFVRQVVPRLGAPDGVEPMVHRQIQRLTDVAAGQADNVAHAVERRMASTHQLATRATRRAFMVGGLCMALVFGLSLLSIRRLRRVVVPPLRRLSAVTAAFARGELDARVGPLGQGEIRALACAFDRMADDLVRRQEELRLADRLALVGQLGAGVAHELNNPIAIIRGYLKAMDPDGDRDVLREELAILDEEAARCQRLAEDFLSYARPTDLSVARVEMSALVREVVDRVRASRTTAVTIDVEPGTVDGDPNRLRQVLLNVVFNAAQVTDSEHGVRVRGRASARTYEVSVEDRGPGVDPALRERIFDPFFTTRGEGTGLGLAIARGIVQAHEGEIVVASREGGGAVFRISIPLRRRKGA